MTDEPMLKRKRRRRGGRYRHTVHDNVTSPSPQHAPPQPQQNRPPMPTPLDALFHELRTLRAEMHHMHQYYQQQWQRQEWRWQQWARGQQRRPQRGGSPQQAQALPNAHHPQQPPRALGEAQLLRQGHYQQQQQGQQAQRAAPPHHHQQQQHHQQQHQQQARVPQREHAIPPQPQHNTQPEQHPPRPEPQPSEPPQTAEEQVVEFDSSDELPLAFEVAEELLVDPVRAPTLLPHALAHTEPATTPLWSRVVSGTTSLPPVVLHTEVVDAFREAAAARTAENVEACGELYARRHGKTLHVVHALMLPQRGTADTCHIVDSEAGDALRFALMDAGLVLAGWIHTHPQFRAFLSSVDMHTQYGYQCTQPAAIAVVLAPRVGEQRVGVFRLTQRGMEEIGECGGRGFHEHDTQCGALFCEARVRMAQGEVDTESGEVLRDVRGVDVE